MKTILIYVLSSRTQPYEAMIQQAMDTWDSRELPGTQTMFYTGYPIAPKIHPRVISFPVENDLHSIGRKNLVAYQWALQNLQWDYMARINSSCYVRKAALLQWVQGLPDKGVLQGIGAPDRGGAMFLWGGAQYIMSRDVVQALVDRSGEWDHLAMEDVAMSRLALKIGIPLDMGGRACSINRRVDNGDWLCIAYGGKDSFEFSDLSEMKRASDQHFIRVKQDGMRQMERMIMETLHRNGI